MRSYNHGMDLIDFIEKFRADTIKIRYFIPFLSSYKFSLCMYLMLRQRCERTNNSLKLIGTITLLTIIFIYWLLIIFTKSYVCGIKTQPSDDNYFQVLPRTTVTYQDSEKFCSESYKFTNFFN